MSLTTSEMTPADFAAVTGGNDKNGAWGDGSWFLIILFLFVFCGWGGNGFGGFRNGGGAGVVDGYVLTSDFANVERKIDNVNNGLCDGFYSQAQLVNGVQQNLSNGFMSAEISRANQQAGLMQQLNAMQMQQANCCCETREAIQGVNYNLAQQSCETRQSVNTAARDIIDNQNANARAILDDEQLETIIKKAEAHMRCFKKVPDPQKVVKFTFLQKDALEIARNMQMNIKTERKEDDLWGTIEMSFNNMWFLDSAPSEWKDIWNNLMKEAQRVYIEAKDNMVMYQYYYDLAVEVPCV